MSWIKSIAILCLFVSLTACSTIRKKTRKGKDVYISAKNRQDLEGYNKEAGGQALFLYKLLSDSDEEFDKGQTGYSFHLLPNDAKHIQAQLLREGSIIASETIRGRYKGGYFQFRRWKVSFTAGPLLWTLTDQVTHVGLSKDHKLVVVYTTGGTLFLLLLPIMAAQGPDAVYDFTWSEK